MASLQVKKRIERGFTRFARSARLGLVGRAVGIDNQVNCWAGNDKIAQQNPGAPKSQHADARPQFLGLRVGCFALSFAAVNNQSTGLGLKIEKMPVEGCNLNAPAG